jgi:hypothetical protein
MANELDPVVIVIDEKPTQESLAKINASLDTTRDRGIRTNQQLGDAWQQQSKQLERMADAHRSAFERILSDVERMANSGGRALEAIFRGAARATAGFLELTGAVVVGKKVFTQTAEDSSVLEKGLEGVRNTARATETAFAGLKGGLGAAIDVAGSIAAVAALEKIVKLTYERGQLLEKQAIQSAKSGLAYPEVAALGFATSRAGFAPDFLDQAAKNAGGAAQLAEQFKKLGEIQDPVERAQKAFQAFGSDADKYLPLLNDRLAENIQRVNEWGLAFSKVDRENITQFKRDLDSLKESFVGLGDTISAWSTSVGNNFARAFGSVWSTLREVPGLAGTSLGIVTGAIDKLTGNRNAGIAFNEEPFDAEAALNQRAGELGAGPGPQSEAAFVQSVQKLAPTGTQYYLGGKGDNESTLQEKVSELQKQLFVSDQTSKDYGKLVPAAQFQGGYAGEALALQQYVSAQQRIEAIDKEKAATAELEAAQKAVAAALRQAQLSELTGSEKLRAERAIAIEQYGKSKELIGQINQEFEIRFREEGKRLIDQSHADLVTRAAASATQQDALLTARTHAQTGAILQAGHQLELTGTKTGEQELLQATASKDSQLKMLELVKADDLTGKLTVEQQKLTIEETFLTKRENLELAGINSTYQKELSELQILLNSKVIRQSDYNLQVAALERNRTLDQKNLEIRTATESEEARMKLVIEANKAIQADNERIAQQEKEQIDSIAHSASKLFETLFTHPQHFGKELTEMLKSATLKPITEGLGQLTGQALRPVIYGPDGQGGIAGAFHGLFGKQDQDSRPLDLNTTAMDKLRAAVLALAATLPAVAGSHTPAGLAHMLVPPGPVATVQSPIGSQLQTGNYLAGSVSIPPGLAAGLPAYEDGGLIPETQVALVHQGEAVIPAVLTQALQTQGATGGLLQQLEKLIGYKGSGQWDTSRSGQHSEASGPVGALQAIAQSQAGTAGEIGLAALAIHKGIEPQWHEAERVVKKLYGISIGHAEGQHIADIANEKYGHHVSIAARSPEVRASLGFHAAPVQDIAQPARSTPAYQTGGLVPETQMALVHQGEAVLPAELTQLLRDAARAYGAQKPTQDQSPLLMGLTASVVAQNQNTAMTYYLSQVIGSGLGVPALAAPAGISTSGVSIPSVSSSGGSSSSVGGPIGNLSRIASEAEKPSGQAAVPSETSTVTRLLASGFHAPHASSDTMPSLQESGYAITPTGLPQWAHGTDAQDFLGYLKYTNTPVFQRPRAPKGATPGTEGQYFAPEEGLPDFINLYSKQLRQDYEPEDYTYGAARVMLHEGTHALLQDQDIGALNKLLPKTFVDYNTQQLTKYAGYDEPSAADELIPRLVAGQAELPLSRGSDTENTFRSFITALESRNPDLATTLTKMHAAIGSPEQEGLTPEQLLVGRSNVPIRGITPSPFSVASTFSPVSYSPSPLPTELSPTVSTISHLLTSGFYNPPSATSDITARFSPVSYQPSASPVSLTAYSPEVARLPSGLINRTGSTIDQVPSFESPAPSYFTSAPSGPSPDLGTAPNTSADLSFFGASVASPASPDTSAPLSFFGATSGIAQLAGTPYFTTAESQTTADYGAAVSQGSAVAYNASPIPTELASGPGQAFGIPQVSAPAYQPSVASGILPALFGQGGRGGLLGTIFGGGTRGGGLFGTSGIPIPGGTYDAGGFERGPNGPITGGNTTGPSFGGFNPLASLQSSIGYKGDGEWNTTSQIGAQSGDFSEASGFTGAIQGIAGSPAGGAAGMFLAQQGLLGRNAGTGVGILEGTAGGALIGEQIGGPLGAAIGAAAGFGIGLGELVAGVEPQWKEAERLVMRTYHVNIDHAEAQRIVDIANQQFGHNVAIAVTSPEVRQMLGVYAAGTGQKIPLSATTPSGGVLQEQGGTLYQAPTYMYGQAFTQASNLPVAGGYATTQYPNASTPTGGGSPAGSPGSPGGGTMQVSLHFDGKNAGDAMTGMFVTPSMVQTQWSQAQAYSDGRQPNQATILQSGLIIS